MRVVRAGLGAAIGLAAALALASAPVQADQGAPSVTITAQQPISFGRFSSLGAGSIRITPAPSILPEITGSVVSMSGGPRHAARFLIEGDKDTPDGTMVHILIPQSFVMNSRGTQLVVDQLSASHTGAGREWTPLGGGAYSCVLSQGRRCEFMVGGTLRTNGPIPSGFVANGNLTVTALVQ